MDRHRWWPSPWLTQTRSWSGTFELPRTRISSWIAMWKIYLLKLRSVWSAADLFCSWDDMRGLSLLWYSLFAIVNLLLQFSLFLFSYYVTLTKVIIACVSRCAGSARTGWRTARQRFWRCLRTWRSRTISTTALNDRLSSRGDCVSVTFKWPTRACTSAMCWPIRTVKPRTVASSVSSVCITCWYLLHRCTTTPTCCCCC